MQINTKLPLGMTFGDFKSSEQDLLPPKVETMIVAPLEMVSPMFIAIPTV